MTRSEMEWKSMTGSSDKKELAEQLRQLPQEERQELLKELENEDEVPILRWSSNPDAVKAAFNFVEREGTVTFEDLRSVLHGEGHIDAEEGSYNFGIVDTENGPFFETSGERDSDTEISLTELGEEYAAVFDDTAGLRPIERTLLIGMQPYGSAYRYLGILEAHGEEGVLREDLEEELVDTYSGSGSYYLGYYNSWFHKLGLIEKERDGRKMRYRLATPSGW